MHFAAIVAHAICGTVAFVAGCVLLSRVLDQHRQAAWLATFAVGLLGMILYMAAAIAAHWEISGRRRSGASTSDCSGSASTWRDAAGTAGKHGARRCRAGHRGSWMISASTSLRFSTGRDRRRHRSPRARLRHHAPRSCRLRRRQPGDCAHQVTRAGGVIAAKARRRSGREVTKIATKARRREAINRSPRTRSRSGRRPTMAPTRIRRDQRYRPFERKLCARRKGRLPREEVVGGCRHAEGGMRRQYLDPLAERATGACRYRRQ